MFCSTSLTESSTNNRTMSRQQYSLFSMVRNGGGGEAAMALRKVHTFSLSKLGRSAVETVSIDFTLSLHDMFVFLFLKKSP